MAGSIDKDTLYGDRGNDTLNGGDSEDFLQGSNAAIAVSPL
jgi:Ca2+-binding RTX toxin-like protein